MNHVKSVPWSVDLERFCCNMVVNSLGCNIHACAVREEATGSDVSTASRLLVVSGAFCASAGEGGGEFYSITGLVGWWVVGVLHPGNIYHIILTLSQLFLAISY